MQEYYVHMITEVLQALNPNGDMMVYEDAARGILELERDLAYAS